VFTNYYPSGGAIFTKPGIVILTGTPESGGGAIMAVWQKLTASNIQISNEMGISINFWSTCDIGIILPYNFMDIINGAGQQVFRIETSWLSSNLRVEISGGSTLTFNDAATKFNFMGFSAVWDGVSSGGTVCLVTWDGSPDEECFHDVAFGNIQSQLSTSGSWTV
jgi:hypothetical protein